MTEIPQTSPLLLSCIQELILVERTLTETLEERKRRRSRPTPISMSQVESILALARTYSSRTSAPPGWRPSNLVVGIIAVDFVVIGLIILSYHVVTCLTRNNSHRLSSILSFFPFFFDLSQRIQ